MIEAKSHHPSGVMAFLLPRKGALHADARKLRPHSRGVAIILVRPGREVPVDPG